MCDGSDLRKPYAAIMRDLTNVNDLAGKFVPGYGTLNVLGVTPKRRGTLYHCSFSSREAYFISEPAEVQLALHTVQAALAAQQHWQSVTWVMDRGFDDVSAWRTIWQQHKHVVYRVKHTERLLAYQTPPTIGMRATLRPQRTHYDSMPRSRPRWLSHEAANRTPKPSRSRPRSRLVPCA